MIIQISIVLTAIAILVAMSFDANARFARESRLPMQWGLDGSVNWTAPRAVALALLPALAAACLAMTLVLPPKPGQAALVLPATAGAAAVFIAIHALHIYLIARTLKL